MKRRKGRGRLVLWLIILATLSALAWIRFAPSAVAQWHVDPHVTANQDLADGVRRRLPAEPGRMEALDAIIRATPRTRVLAGSARDGFVTYVTRSKWFGFPDYTTVRQENGQIGIWGRLRFGLSDMGVNKARVDGWLASLDKTP
ncbi:DUF1499 domain-containing protein [Mesobacterium sp. TK19101]|uniref:DUF1499 domain-containing protein n=1 Tax=Mesobacterium hydrothermale TaxID=3111907 RepID=A0ABU6HDT8_9RHOB|nr:DUF1499 domain-containing protein [Mesobacterium sp. TK19101]MEC3860628.1 DUF1499 domain-containing protein [Mesobacterium sp. TK19101]